MTKTKYKQTLLKYSKYIEIDRNLFPYLSVDFYILIFFMVILVLYRNLYNNLFAPLGAGRMRKSGAISSATQTGANQSMQQTTFAVAPDFRIKVNFPEARPQGVNMEVFSAARPQGVLSP